MTFTDRFDVAIIGAGPAGCRAAWRMARAGARVAIVDGSHPREKPCGGGVTGRALDLLGDALDARQLGMVPIETGTFEHRSRMARMSLGRKTTEPPRLAVASRLQFDAALLHAARTAGAHLVASRAIDVLRDATGWTVATRDGTLHSDWLLGADGPGSIVRRRVVGPFARADLSVASGYFVHGTSSREIALAFTDNPAGYLWSFPRADHLAVGVCAQADEATSAALLAAASKWIERNVSGAVRLERYSWAIPSLRVPTLEREQPAGERWMLLGDAAGMVDPITREGIFFALMSADAAADSLLGRRDPSTAYARRVRATIYAELIRAARLKTRFFHPRFTRLLVHALERSAPIRAVMSDLIAGHQSYHGLRRRLLRTMELRLLIDLMFSMEKNEA